MVGNEKKKNERIIIRGAILVDRHKGKRCEDGNIIKYNYTINIGAVGEISYQISLQRKFRYRSRIGTTRRGLTVNRGFISPHFENKRNFLNYNEVKYNYVQCLYMLSRYANF